VQAQTQQQGAPAPDRLVGYWNVAETRKQEWQDLDGQLTKLLDGKGVCPIYAQIHEKMDQAKNASALHIAALQQYYAANRQLHEQLLKDASAEAMGSQSLQRHLQELSGLEDKYLEQLYKRREELAAGIETAKAGKNEKANKALKTLDDLIDSAKDRQRLREETMAHAQDKREINAELQRQAGLLLELANKHSETVDLENAMWNTYYEARSSRLTLTCGPNNGMRAPQPVYPHKKQ
jgi:hypothetical protein